MRISDLVEKKFIGKIKRKQFLDPVGKEAADYIKVRTRKGYGVESDKGPERRFDKLEDSTIKARTRMKKRGRLLSGEGVSRSNLTATGKLTESISYKTKASASEVELYLDDNRGDGVSNQTIKDGLEDQGRSFFHLSKNEHKKLYNFIRRSIKDIIRKF